MNEAPWRSPMPALIFGLVAVAALLGVFVLVLISVRRREASPWLAVGALAGAITMGLMFLAMAFESGALHPFLARYPLPVRGRISSGLHWMSHAVMAAIACAVIVLGLEMIVGSFAMLPRLRRGGALRLMVFSRGYPNIVEHWDKLTLWARIQVWFGSLVMAGLLLYFGAIVLGLTLGLTQGPGVLGGWWLFHMAFPLSYCLVLSQLSFYDARARRLARQSQAEAPDPAASA
ncbi:MAG TPA: hypothetical protein VM221_11305 [Armatimonadota bacterium]|nr:hypothetical protein [Armatimonadota bacterium]